MRRAELRHWFAHHPPRDHRVADLHQQTRLRCLDLAEWLNTALPPSEEAKQALKALDDVCRHANAAIARHANYPPADDDG